MKRVAAFRIAAALVAISLSPSERAMAAQYTDPVIGYSFTYPDDWMVQPKTTGGVIVRNFPREKRLPGGSPRMGGAEIIVFSYPPYPSWWPPGTDEYQWLEHFGQNYNVLVHPSRSAPGPARLVVTLQTPAGTVDTSESLTMRVGGRVFQINLEYQTGDPNTASYERVLSGVVDSLALAKQEAIPTAAGRKS